MSMKETFKQSATYKEYSSNKRLQWMIVAIMMILSLSIVKSLIDAASAEIVETKQQVDLLAKLKSTSSQPFDEEKAQLLDSNLKEKLNALPKAPSSSVAEASALASIEDNIGKLVTRKRLNLLGSESLLDGKYWSVRVDINGQLDSKKYVDLLTHFDQTSQHMRIASLRYSPKTSNAIGMVVDILFKQAPNE